jgi:hypothetical protein
MVTTYPQGNARRILMSGERFHWTFPSLSTANNTFETPRPHGEGKRERFLGGNARESMLASGAFLYQTASNASKVQEGSHANLSKTGEKFFETRNRSAEEPARLAADGR